MADSKKETTLTKKVLKIALLPGFDNSIKQMSFLLPVLMRVLGSIFESAGLIRRNHPALNYGAEGVEKTSFIDVMSEAWFTLKTGERNYFQMGIYGSVCLMVAASITVFFVALMGISTTLFSAASAQLFDHPNEGMDTSMTSIPDPTASATMLNTSVDQYMSADRTDWGIIIIDKLFREGIMGKGGALQNAFGALLEVFNGAILIIAAIMIFWIIISIIVDMAKTGEVGGGRHNMVWTPIRIIFALCLLIPLGSTGFSAGQLAVIKVAEWGSNLGTKGWYLYVKSATDQGLASGTDVENLRSTIDNLNQIWICRVAVNASLSQMGIFEENKIENEITIQLDAGNVKYDKKSRSYVYPFNFRNLRGDECGKIVVRGKPSPRTDSSVPVYIDKYYESINKAYALPIATDSGVSYAMAGKYDWSKNSEIYAAFKLEDAPIIKDSKGIKDFACSIAGVDMAENRLQAIDECSSWSLGRCGEATDKKKGDKESAVPDDSCYNHNVEKYQNDVITAIHKANDELIKEVTGIDSGIAAAAKADGWPSMGWWYHELYKINDIFAEAGKSTIEIRYTGIKGWGGIYSKAKNAEKAYAKWWTKMIGTNTSLSDTNTGELTPFTDASRARLAESGVSGSAMDLKQLFSALEGKDADGKSSKSDGHTDKAASQSVGIMRTITGIFISPITNGLFPRIRDALSADQYPIVKVANVGYAMLDTGLIIYDVQSMLYIIGALLSIIGGFIPLFSLDGFYNLAQAIVSGPIGQMLKVVSNALIASALVPLYYVPFIPFVKVAFAVLTWILAIFEAVIMTPVIALSYINTKEGLSGKFFPLLASILFHPIMIVIGFVGSILVLNTFITYFNFAFAKAALGSADLIQAAGALEIGIRSAVIAVIYGTGIYLAINTSFELLEALPKSFAGHIGAPTGSVQAKSDLSGGIGAVGGAVTGALGKSFEGKQMKKQEKPKKGEGSAEVSNSEKGNENQIAADKESSEQQSSEQQSDSKSEDGKSRVEGGEEGKSAVITESKGAGKGVGSNQGQIAKGASGDKNQSLDKSAVDDKSDANTSSAPSLDKSVVGDKSDANTPTAPLSGKDKLKANLGKAAATLEKAQDGAIGFLSGNNTGIEDEKGVLDKIENLLDEGKSGAGDKSAVNSQNTPSGGANTSTAPLSGKDKLKANLGKAAATLEKAQDGAIGFLGGNNTGIEDGKGVLDKVKNLLDESKSGAGDESFNANQTNASSPSKESIKDKVQKGATKFLGGDNTGNDQENDKK